MVAPLLICASFGKGHGIAGGATNGAGGGGGVREHVPPPPPEAAAVHVQRGEGQLGLLAKESQACSTYRSVVGEAWTCAAQLSPLMTPWVLKPPQPWTLSQQASRSATLRFLLPPQEGCGLTSPPPQSDFSIRRYFVSLAV